MFKSGDWIIRKWNEKWKSHIDFAQFNSDINGREFIHGKFFRFIGELSIDLSAVGTGNDCPYIDDLGRMEYDWRLATEKEREEYLLQIIKLESNPFK